MIRKEILCAPPPPIGNSYKLLYYSSEAKGEIATTRAVEPGAGFSVTIYKNENAAGKLTSAREAYISEASGTIGDFSEAVGKYVCESNSAKFIRLYYDEETKETTVMAWDVPMNMYNGWYLPE